MTCCSPLKMIKQDLLRFPTFFWTDLCVKTLGFFLKLTSYKLVSNRNSKTRKVSSFYLNIENLSCSNAWFSIGPKSVTEPQVNVISTNNLFWFSYASLFVYSMFFSCLFFLNANVLLFLQGLLVCSMATRPHPSLFRFLPWSTCREILILISFQSKALMLLLSLSKTFTATVTGNGKKWADFSHLANNP